MVADDYFKPPVHRFPFIHNKFEQASPELKTTTSPTPTRRRSNARSKAAFVAKCGSTMARGLLYDGTRMPVKSSYDDEFSRVGTEGPGHKVAFKRADADGFRVA
jgi:hypothetical protein